jgi:pyruvate/2-oxoglutarate/acetoin dehydrogenase E1 component
MAKLSFRDAIRAALIEEMRRSPAMFAIGEDLIPQGGSFGVHKGLAEMFPGRILQTPISEAAIVGVAVGGALAGGPVVAEIMFSDFMTCCMDEIVNQAAKLRYMSGGQARVPLVVRTPCGLGKGIAAQHSQALETFYMHVPGLQVAVPATPADAKGLLKTALRSDDPTIFLEYKLLYAIEGEVPDDPDFSVPFGKARIHREGDDVTIVATGRMVHFALTAAETLAAEGIEAEVVDPRTLSPLDLDTLTASVRKTSRAVVVDEAVVTCSPASEIAASLSESCFGWLDAPIKRVASPHVPKPFTPVLESLSVPDVAAILSAVRGICKVRA